jgi:hypothetical protein
MEDLYVLDNQLQSGKPFHKWGQRSKIGVYLGKSPQHGRSVALVLSRETGLVSPQFHVAFDPTFRTVKDITSKSQWQIKAGFVMQPKMIQERAQGNAETRHDGPLTKTHTNSKGARKQLKRKRKSQETIDEGGEGDPETRNNNRRAPAAAKGTDDGIPTLNRAQWQRDRASGSTLRSNETIQPKGEIFTGHVTSNDDGTCGKYTIRRHWRNLRTSGDVPRPRT